MNYIGNEIDYISIGKRIKKIRIEKNISQENLAEKVGVSTTHMSHIETGSTKLSLNVFVKIVDALKISADIILDNNFNTNRTEDLNEILLNTTDLQSKIILEIAKSTKKILKDVE